MPAVERQTREGSEAHRIALAVARTTTAAGQALTLADCHAAYVAAHGDTCPAPHYAASFFSLVRRGILVRAGGRCSQSQYAHRDHRVAASDATDDAARVLAALTAACAVHGRAVTTREVRHALASTGGPLVSTDINAVRVRLATMARQRRSGDPAWRSPRVLAVPTRSERGRPTARWMPSALGITPTPQAVSVPATRADAVRGLVARVERALGHPVTRRELRAWCDAHPECAGTLAGRDSGLGPLLVGTAANDAKARVPGRGIRRLASARTCWGGAMPRYTAAPTAAGLLAVAIEDAAIGLRVADEVAALDALARDRQHGEALQPLIALRQEALQCRVAEITRAHADARPDALCEAAQILAASVRTRLAWLPSSDRSTDAARIVRASLQDAARHTTAFVALAASAYASPHSPTVGASGGVPLATLDEFFSAAEMELHTPRTIVRRACLRGVRRVPLRGGRGTFGVHTHQSCVGVDRVDALLRTFRLKNTTHASALLSAAERLLGPILRDAAPLMALVRHPHATRAMRAAAAVAMGLLGVALPTDLVDALLAADDDGLIALQLALVLSGASSSARGLAGRSRRGWLVARRLEQGYLLTAVE